MLSKQHQVIDNRAQLNIVVQPPYDHEATQDSGTQHEEPLLNKQRYNTNDNPDGNSDKNWHVDMTTEEVDIDGC